jgi:hypothetical protein
MIDAGYIKRKLLEAFTRQFAQKKLNAVLHEALAAYHSNDRLAEMQDDAMCKAFYISQRSNAHAMYCELLALNDALNTDLWDVLRKNPELDPWQYSLFERIESPN